LNWIGIAIARAALLGLVNIIDSHILTVRIGRFGTYLSILAPVYLVFGTIAYLISPSPASIGPGLWLFAVGASVVKAAAIMIMLYTFKTQAVSRVIPVVYAYPILVAIMAIPLLREVLGLLSWAAVIIVVAGVVMVTTTRNSHGRTSASMVMLLLLTCGLFAVNDLSSKYLLGYLTFWKLFSINALVMGTVLALASFRPGGLRKIKEMEHRNLALTIIVLNEVAALAGLLLGTLAISKGPVSVVSAILGSRPVFVVIFAILIAFTAPHFLNTESIRERMPVKVIATLMTVSGIALIYLT
jgi:uncharacterized membrane protein